jgi:hypothetical protein
MGPDKRPPVPLSHAGGWVDDVVRMLAFLKRHQEVTWLRPGQAGVADHTATWIDAGPDQEGTPVTVSQKDLGRLVDYLEDRFDRG